MVAMIANKTTHMCGSLKIVPTDLSRFLLIPDYDLEYPPGNEKHMRCR